MADAVSRVSVQLAATGGSTAAGEVQRVTDSFNGIQKAHGNMKDKFAERFQHVGVMLFGRDLMKMAGIGEGAESIIMTLNMAVRQLGLSFGVVTGVMGMVVMGLGAVAAIAYKVMESQKKLKDALVESVTAGQKQLEVSNELTKKLGDYAAVHGKLTPQLLAAAEANNKLKEAQAALLVLQLPDRIDQLKKELEKLTEEYNKQEVGVAATAAMYSRYAAGSDAAAKSTKEVNKLVNEATVKHEDLRVRIALLTEAYTRLKQGKTVTWEKETDDLKKFGTAYDTMVRGAESALSRLQQKEQQYHIESVRATDASMQAKRKIIQLEAKRELDAIEEVYRNEVLALGRMLEEKKIKQEAYDAERNKLDKQHGATRSALMKQTATKDLATVQEFFGVQKTFSATSNTMMYNTSKQAFDKIVGEFSGAMASMMVEGKAFSMKFTDVVKGIVTMFIEAIVQMTIRWAAFMAMKSAFGVASGGAGFFMQSGGHEIVTKPTMFVAGEAGPERVTVQPLHGFKAAGGGLALAGAGAGGGSTSINLGGITMNVSGAQDPRTIASQVGREIIKQIRGMGQLDFRRTA